MQRPVKALLSRRVGNRSTLVRHPRGLATRSLESLEYGGHAGDGAALGRKPYEECRGIGHSFAFNRAEGYDIYMSRTASGAVIFYTLDGSAPTTRHGIRYQATVPISTTTVLRAAAFKSGMRSTKH